LEKDLMPWSALQKEHPLVNRVVIPVIQKSKLSNPTIQHHTSENKFYCNISGLDN
jgi:hypothetical protein